MRERGGSGLGQAWVAWTPPLTWQPQLRGSVALCGRGLPAPKRAAGATRAGSRWLRPPSQPIRGRRQLQSCLGGADPASPWPRRPGSPPRAPPRIRIAPTPRPGGRTHAVTPFPVSPPQLRPPPTGRGRGLKDTLTPPQLSRRFQRARFRDSFLRPLALRLEENSG